MPPAAAWSRTSTPIVGVAVAPGHEHVVAGRRDGRLDGRREHRGGHPSVVTDHDRARLALAGISRREFGGDHRVDPVADNPAQARDARDPCPLSTHQACPPRRFRQGDSPSCCLWPG